MWTLQDAKNRLSAVVANTRGYRPSFTEHLLAFPGEPDLPWAKVRPPDVAF